MLINKFKRDQAVYMPYINTGALHDLATGAFQSGTNGLWVLNGGLSVITAITGRAQTFKSGLAGSMLARALNLHPNAGAIVVETEGSLQDASRYDDFVPLDRPVSDRIAFYSSATTLDEVDDLLKELCAEKLANKKDLIIDSPFLDVKTGKPFKIWTPTFMFVDSFSRLKSDKADKMLDDGTIDGKDTNMYWMAEGGAKTKFMVRLASRCMQAGVYMILTAHVGDNQSLTAHAAPKQLPNMKGTDKLKSVGSQFEFLATTLIQTTKAEVLKHKTTGKCMYPNIHSTDMEINDITTTMVRGKNNATGYQIPTIISQYQGVMDELTYHHYLKGQNNYGLHVKGNNEKFSPQLLNQGEDAKNYYDRKNLRDRADKDYELVRALELTAQLCFIRSQWNTRKLPGYILTNPMELAEKLKNSDKAIVSRVLNSTSQWTTDPNPERERLTILDALSLLSNPKA